MTDKPVKPQVLDPENTLNIENHLKKEISDETQSSGCWEGRHTLALLGFLGIAVSYTLRVNLTIAIVAMVKPARVNGLNYARTGSNDTWINDGILNNSNSAGFFNNFNDSVDLRSIVNSSDADKYFYESVSIPPTTSPEPSTEYCPMPESTSDEKVVEGTFEWDSNDQGLILGAFYYGYAATNFLGGRAAEHWGGRKVMGLGVFLTGVLTTLVPTAAHLSRDALVLARVLTGMAQGVVYPSLNTVLAAWIPPKDRSKYVTFVYVGLQAGTLFSLPVSGLICQSTLGWPVVFYAFGVLGMVWAVPWVLLVRDNPEDHPRISRKELAYIKSFGESVKKKEVVGIPWAAMVRSPGVWAVVVASIGNGVGFHTLLTGTPTFLASVLHLDVAKSGILGALPYLCMGVWACAWGCVMDILVHTHVLSVLQARKLSGIAGSYLPALGLVLVCVVGCDATLALVALCVAVGSNGMVFSSFHLSSQDIAPNLAGTLMGVTNTMAAVTGIVAPAVTGALVQDAADPSAWRVVFLASAAVYVAAFTIYVCCVTDQVQPWNNPAGVMEKEAGDDNMREIAGQQGKNEEEEVEKPCTSL